MEQQNVLDQRQEVPKGKILIPTLEYGVVLSLISIVLSLILFFLGMSTNSLVSTVSSILVNVVVLMWILKNYRDVKNNGILSYGRGLGIGTLSFLWAGIVMSVYIYLFFTVISPESIDLIYEQQFENLLESGMSEEAALDMMEKTSFFTSPLFMSIATIFMTPFWGFILSLIVSAIYKSDTPKN